MFSFILLFVFIISQLQINRRNTVYFKVIAHCVCCVWNSLEQVWGSECAAGGFVVGACRHCVVVSRGNLVAAVLRQIY
jgi:nucleoside recognition membrane protein YjiH